MTGEAPVAQTSLLPAEGAMRIRRILGNLPSRAADNLFWFGRYLERAEAVLRLIRAFAGRLIETNTIVSDDEWTSRRLVALLDRAGAVPEDHALEGMALAAAALFGKEEFGSAFCLVQSARRAASYIRERLSVDAWRLVEDLYDGLDRDPKMPLTEADGTERIDATLRALSSIAGLAQENMNRGAGWHLLDMGRRVERGINTCRFARQLADPEGQADGLSVLLELIDSQITYRSRYLVGLSLPLVRDMVVLDAYNPRSVAFQVERLEEHLANLPRLNEDGMMEVPRRMVVQLSGDLKTSIAALLDNKTILGFEQRLLGLADAIGARYFLHGPNAVRAEKAVGLA